MSLTMVVVESRGLRVVYDAQIERRQMPTLNLGIRCNNKPDPVPFITLHGPCAVLMYLYTYFYLYFG